MIIVGKFERNRTIVACLIKIKIIALHQGRTDGLNLNIEKSYAPTIIFNY